ncbi:MAG: hypothetical protein KDI42_02400 [Gammaproteobacteria bacterium]|nr:hypothetical protein [Gammaproteobacteria bacterium]
MNHTEQTLMIAIASMDGNDMPKTHFGEAPRFELYRVSVDAAAWQQTVVNPGADAHQPDHGGHGHGDTGKGAGIGHLLGSHGVEVMVSRAFGANIQRMRQRFLPIKVDVPTVAEALTLIRAAWPRVVTHWEDGVARKHLVLHGPV